METITLCIAYGLVLTVAAIVGRIWWKSGRYDLNDPQERADYEINRQFW